MSRRIFPLVAAMALSALAAPASAQIIATSIPKEFTGSGKAGTPEKKWAFHVMGAPVAKWKINAFEEDGPLLLTTSANPNSKFLGAAEVAFRAGDNFTVGVGGWFNKVGTTDYDFLFLDGESELGFNGTRTDALTYTEGHVNLFYKDFGIQVGVVHTAATSSNFVLRNFVFSDTVLSRQEIIRILGSDSLVRELESSSRRDISTNDIDAYLIYKVGSRVGGNLGWTVSAGAGIYRYTDNSKTVPSAFGTLSLDLYKGLGVDASFWYIGKSSSDLAEAIDVTDTVSRFSIGIGYTFSK
jgi:hypothetical protein